MLRNSFYLLLFILPLFTFCGSTINDPSLTIEGTISNGANLKIFFDQYDVVNRSSQIIRDASINGKGEFKIYMEEKPAEGIYRFRIGSVASLFILDGSENKIKINGTLDEIKQISYDIEGSRVMKEFTDLMREFKDNPPTVNQITEKIKSLENPYVKGVVTQSMLSSPSDYLDLYEQVNKDIQNSNAAQSFKDSYQSFFNTAQATALQKAARERIKVGQEAPEISLLNPAGEMVNLTDYRGQLVLLDFWASWCRPCRIANPHVVEMYDKYKDQGFTVFSVSLDGLDERTKARFGGDEVRISQQLEQEKKKWIAAIDQDKLKWDGHVSDLKKWDSYASRLYGVSSIPKTFLIGRDGKIVEIDPRYTLESAIQKHL